jgi:uncharacterized protein YjbI with pentapeptide repeats
MQSHGVLRGRHGAAFRLDRINLVNPHTIYRTEQTQAVDGIADGDSHQPRSALGVASPPETAAEERHAPAPRRLSRHRTASIAVSLFSAATAPLSPVEHETPEFADQVHIQVTLERGHQIQRVFLAHRPFVGALVDQRRKDVRDGGKLTVDDDERARAEHLTATIAATDMSSAYIASADFQGADVGAVDMSGSNLTGADLSNARMTSIILANANLTDANLSGAKLKGADLRGALLLRTDLTGADLREAKVPAPLDGFAEDLRETLAMHHQWITTNATQGECADLSGKDLQSIDFSGLNLCGANLEGACLEQARLNSSLMLFANLRGANLAGANLANAQLNGADFSGASLCGASLVHADLGPAEFGRDSGSSEPKYWPTKLVKADLTNANLCEANLAEADLREARLEHDSV